MHLHDTSLNRRIRPLGIYTVALPPSPSRSSSTYNGIGLPQSHRPHHPSNNYALGTLLCLYTKPSQYSLGTMFLLLY